MIAKKTIKPVSRQIFPGDVFVKRIPGIYFASLVPQSSAKEEVYMVLTVCQDHLGIPGNWCNLYNLSNGYYLHMVPVTPELFSRGEITFLWPKPIKKNK